MVKALLALALCFAGSVGATAFPSVKSRNEEVTPTPTVPDTSSFNSAFSMSLSTEYQATISNSEDVDYYSFTPSESGFYTFLVRGRNYTVRVYTQIGTKRPSLFATYVISSYEPNYGRNHVIFVDLAEYDTLYYAVSKSDPNALSPYHFRIEPITARNNGSFELVRYDVDERLYSFLYYDSSSWFGGSPYSYGYDPNRIRAGTYPSNYAAGSYLPLNADSGYDTTSEYPYSAVGRIVTYASGAIGTGFLIGKNVFATAAHCVSGPTHCRNLWGMDICFGNNSEDPDSLRGDFRTIYMSPSYWDGDNGDSDHDWAICLLDDSYGQDVGYFSFIKQNAAYINANHHFLIDGYKNAATYQTLSYADYLSMGTRRLYITRCTEGGDSGAPIYDLTAGCVVGIIGGATPTISYGTYFTDDMFYFARYLIGGNYL